MKGKEAPEVLKKVQKDIQHAVTVRMLRSGDMNVLLLSEAVKNDASKIPPTATIKVLKRDYLIKVPEVPLHLEIAREKYTNNNHLTGEICSSSKRLVPEL